MSTLLQGVRITARSLRCTPAAPLYATKPIGRRRPLSTTTACMQDEFQKRKNKDLKRLEQRDGDSYYQLKSLEDDLENSFEDPDWLVNEAAENKRWAELMGNSMDEVDKLAEPPVSRRRDKIPNTFINLGERPEDGEEPLELDGEEEEGDEYDNMSVLGHGELAKHQEMRHYARLAAWDLPMLSKLAKPFVPPTADMPLRFRYTTYMGETHPAEKKVALEFCIGDMPDLTTAQRQKLRKLSGTRYNPETDLVKMSCEMYESQAQNKRYLGDRVDELLKEARDSTDTFEDIPLDLRHHKFKARPIWPQAWSLTEKRRAELEAYRQNTVLEDQRRILEGALVDGTQAIEAAYAKKKLLTQAPIPEMVMAGKGRKAVRVGR